MTQEEVQKLADLARLTLTPEEIARYTGQLDVIFHHVEQLNSLNVTDVLPTSHVWPLKNVIREDREIPGLVPGQLSTFAPEVEHDQFVVPKIMEGD